MIESILATIEKTRELLIAEIAGRADKHGTTYHNMPKDADILHYDEDYQEWGDRFIWFAFSDRTQVYFGNSAVLAVGSRIILIAPEEWGDPIEHKDLQDVDTDCLVKILTVITEKEQEEA